MPRLEPLADDKAPAEAQSIFAAINDQFGLVPNIFRTMAYQPAILEAVTSLNRAIQGDLPDKYRELAYLKSSKVNGCAYCGQHHTQAAAGAGVTDAQIKAIDNDATGDLFDEKEKAVLRFAEQLTKTADVDEAIVEQLKGFLSDPQLVQLAATVGLANFTNRFNHAFDIELP